MDAKREENNSLKRISSILNSAAAVILFSWIVRRHHFFFHGKLSLRVSLIAETLLPFQILLMYLMEKIHLHSCRQG